MKGLGVVWGWYPAPGGCVPQGLDFVLEVFDTLFVVEVQLQYILVGALYICNILLLVGNGLLEGL